MTGRPVASLARRVLGDPVARLAIGVSLALVVIAGVGPGLARYGPTVQVPAGLDQFGSPRPPSRQFLLGTDGLGRDVLSRLLTGARVSLTAAAVAVLISTSIGVSTGLLAGCGTAAVDFVLLRIAEVVMTLPTILLSLLLAALLTGPPGGPVSDHAVTRGLVRTILMTSIVSWGGMMRAVRAQSRQVMTSDFVVAARAVGCTFPRIVVHHVLPNVLPVVVVQVGANAAAIVLLESSLGYLGLGVPPPLPSWGRMIADGQPYLLTAPWLVIPPGVAVVVTVATFTFLSRGLERLSAGQP